MCHYVVRPCVSILLGHVSRPKLPTFLFLIRPRGMMDLYQVFCLYWPTCHVMAVTRDIHWFVHVLDSYLTTCLCRIYHVHTNHYTRENNFRSTLLHKMTTCIIILNMNQITIVQLRSKPLTEFTYQVTKISHQNNKQTTCSLHQQDWELPALKSMICLAFFKEKVLHLAWERTLETTSATSSTRIVSITSCENQRVNIRKRT